jgi:hypothetical protein
VLLLPPLALTGKIRIVAIVDKAKIAKRKIAITSLVLIFFSFPLFSLCTYDTRFV